MGSRAHLLRPYLTILGLVTLTEGAIMGLTPWLFPRSSAVVQSLADPLLLLALAGPAGWLVMRRVQRDPGNGTPMVRIARRKALLWTGGVFACGLILTAVATYLLRRDLVEEADAEFEHQAENARTALEIGFLLPAHGLRGAAGMVVARGGNLDAEAFRAWVAARDLPGEFPGVHGFAWIERIPKSGLAEASTIDLRGGAAPEVFTVRYAEPSEGNPTPLGVTLDADPVTRAAIEHAVATGELTLVSAPFDGGGGHLLLFPVYKVQNPEPGFRQASLLGLVCASIDLDVLFGRLFGDPNAPIQVELRDPGAGNDAAIVYRSPPFEADHSPRFTSRQELVVGGKSLELVTVSTPAGETHIERSSPKILGAVGGVVSALLALTTWLLASGRARAESYAAEMNASLDRLAKVAERTTNAVLITDAARTVAWVNQGLLRMSGLREPEVIGRPLTEIGAALALDEAALAGFGEAMSRREGFRGELLATAKGRPLWLDLEIEPLGGERFTGLMIVAADITERKDALARMEAAKREIESLLTTIRRHAIVSIADRDGQILDVNDAFCELTGYSREELVGQDHRKLNSGVQPRRFWQEMWKTLASGQPWRGEICNRAKDGSLHWVDSIIAPCLAEDGTVEKFISIRSDITARKRTEERLREARNAAEKASGAKSRFLANMSHEIRTPMNAVLGMLTLLQRTELSEDQGDYVRKTERAARSLLEILNDILDFSKVEAGKLDLDPRPFELGAALKDLWTLLSANVGDKPIEVHFELDPELPATLLGDALRLQQVLINLGGNAIKFTTEGEVVVRVRVVERTERDVALLFEVSDTGIGIAAEHLGQIFEGFTQAETSTTRRFGGTGLGLTISRRLVELMGGSLTVESQVGVGSTFRFEIRLPIAAEGAAENTTFPATRDDRLAGLRILVVEDNALNQEVAKGLLVGAGAEVELASNGKRGVEAVARAERPFDVVLMDIQMPVMDGYEATREIRWTLGMGRLPIVAMTANAMASDRAACLAAGMDEHVGKPLVLKTLCDTIRTLTSRRVETVDEGLVAAEAPLPPEALAEAARAGVDLARALERMEGNVGLYVRLVRSFLREVPKFVDALERSGGDGDALRAMHTLKGLAATVGAEALAALAKELHGVLKESGGEAGADAVERLRSSVAEATDSLTRITQLLESDRSLIASIAPASAGADALKRHLLELTTLLESSDLRALDVYEQLQREHSALEGELVPLGEAVSAMNFTEGIAQCQSLLRRFAS